MSGAQESGGHPEPVPGVLICPLLSVCPMPWGLPLAAFPLSCDLWHLEPRVPDLTRACCCFAL